MMFTVFLTIGPGTMFNSMKGKYDRQALLMLPASNFEKYLMRYASWLILLPLFIVSVLCSDLIQYAVNYMLGNEKTMFVVSKAMELLSRSWTDTPAKELNGLIIPLACFMPLAVPSSAHPSMPGCSPHWLSSSSSSSWPGCCLAV